jgi:hypothetical protein
VEEEGESLIDVEHDQEGIIRNHRRAILHDLPHQEYFNGVYRKLVQRRHEERKSTLESQISTSEVHAWEVIFKVPEGEAEAENKKESKYK